MGIKLNVASHLIDVLQFIDDLIYHRVRSLHFDFWICGLSLDPIAHHTERMCVCVCVCALCGWGVGGVNGFPAVLCFRGVCQFRLILDTQC